MPSPARLNCIACSSVRSKTDLGIDDLLPLVGIAPQLLSDDTRISRHLIGINYLTPYVTESGAQVLIPDRPAIWKLIKQEVYGQ